MQRTFRRTSMERTFGRTFKRTFRVEWSTVKTTARLDHVSGVVALIWWVHADSLWRPSGAISFVQLARPHIGVTQRASNANSIRHEILLEIVRFQGAQICNKFHSRGNVIHKSAQQSKLIHQSAIGWWEFYMAVDRLI